MIKLEFNHGMAIFKKLANNTKTLAMALIVMLLLLALAGSVHAQPAPEQREEGLFVVSENPFLRPCPVGRIDSAHSFAC